MVDYPIRRAPAIITASVPFVFFQSNNLLYILRLNIILHLANYYSKKSQKTQVYNMTNFTKNALLTNFNFYNQSVKEGPTDSDLLFCFSKSSLST